MEDNRNMVGYNITRIRKELGLKQYELLSKIQVLGVDMNQEKLCRIEKQRVAVADRDLYFIAKALGVSIDTFR